MKQIWKKSVGKRRSVWFRSERVYFYNAYLNNFARVTHGALVFRSSLLKIKLRTLENENETIGVLLSSKAIVQLFMNPLVGVLTSYVGYNLPIFLGSILLIVVSVREYSNVAAPDAGREGVSINVLRPSAHGTTVFETKVANQLRVRPFCCDIGSV